jgi:hypothetical protein
MQLATFNTFILPVCVKTLWWLSRAKVPSTRRPIVFSIVEREFCYLNSCHKRLYSLLFLLFLYLSLSLSLVLLYIILYISLFLSFSLSRSTLYISLFLSLSFSFCCSLSLFLFLTNSLSLSTSFSSSLFSSGLVRRISNNIGAIQNTSVNWAQICFAFLNQ